MKQESKLEMCLSQYQAIEKRCRDICNDKPYYHNDRLMRCLKCSREYARICPDYVSYKIKKAGKAKNEKSRN